jgi:16S rRNA processing protein RimM
VRLKSFTANPEDIMTYGDLITDQPYQKIVIQSLKPKTRDVFLARLQDVNDRTAAEHLKGVKLYLLREQLPALSQNEYYQADLIGLQVIDLNGHSIGTIRGLHNFGAGDIVEVGLLDHTTVMIPFTKTACPEVNLSEGYIVIDDHVLEELKGL